MRVRIGRELASAGGTCGTRSPSPTARNSSIVRGVKPRARGCFELPGCFSTTTVGTPFHARNTAVERPTTLPPTTSTEVVFCPLAFIHTAFRYTDAEFRRDCVPQSSTINRGRMEVAYPPGNGLRTRRSFLQRR